MRFSLLLLTVILMLVSCKSKEKQNDSIEKNLEAEISPLKKGEVSVLTQSMEFIAADTLMSGWNTLIYENKSTEVHFLLMDLYPVGKTISDTKSDILPPFDEGMKLIMEGDIDNAVAAFAKLPEWFYQVEFKGGTGLVSPKHTVKSTVYLKPGTYIMECYVKMFNGEWHTSHGMLKQIIVTGDSTMHKAPTPTISLDISSTDGIVLKDSVTSGKQIFETNFIDQKVYEHFIGHDINLVRYENNASMDSLIQWMNWMNPRGLRSPAPKGFTFLGGMNNLSAGEKGYFEANLKPGNYALISEVPNANEQKMLHTFTIK